MAKPRTRSHTKENQKAQSNVEPMQSGTPLTMEAFIQAVEILGERPVRKHASQPEPQNRPLNTIAKFKKLSPLAFSGHWPS